MICFLWILIGIYLKCTLCDRSCGERNHVIGAEGGDVLLQVDPDGVMGDITWFLSGNHFATSEPGKIIKIRDSRYKEKVDSTEDGSVLMKNLAKKDEGTYIASTLKSTSGIEELCALIYDLRVYEMLSDDNIEIDYEVSSNETCNVTFICTVRTSDVTITWESSTNNDVNVTSNVVHVQDPDLKVIYTCTAWNPISSVSKSVTPWEYCKIGRQQISEDYKDMNIIRLKLAGFLLIITCFILGHHIKTEVVVSSTDNK
ncbi:SLAM family member 5-like [Bufo gargarizans]|uniref:SLAM family member 5-like n=1 Tax=Bufo gargarizans TaxID=30331 RepID=UPI001CF44EAF|nr:SLAM family member 5-like [Bufo gargarizans]